MYAEQLAWLDAKPKDSQGLSRRQMFDSPAMPDLGYGAHLFHAIGFLRDVSYQEINICPATKSLPDWEKIAIIKIKNAHESMSYKATEKGFPAPYQTEESAVNQFDAMWSGMMASIPQGMEGKPMTAGTV